MKVVYLRHYHDIHLQSRRRSFFARNLFEFITFCEGFEINIRITGMTDNTEKGGRIYLLTMHEVTD